MDNNIVQSLQRIMDCYFREYVETEIKKIPHEEIIKLEGIIEPLFIFALIWSTMATVDYDSRLKFDEFLRELMKKNNSPVSIPTDGMVYDF